MRLLDGGRKKVEAAGLPLTQESPSHRRKVKSAFHLLDATNPDFPRRGCASNQRSHRRSSSTFVRLRSTAANWRRRRICPRNAAQRKGHIPGAVNVPWAKAVAEDGTFKADDELAQLYASKGVTPDKDVTVYCRIGERSSHTWFVLSELLGYPNVRNYDGSWTEYGSLVGVPIELGEAA